jgi:benzoate membrane transport protein
MAAETPPAASSAPAEGVRLPNFWRDLSLTHLANGLVGFLFAASGPLAIILATAARGGLTEAQPPGCSARCSSTG